MVTKSFATSGPVAEAVDRWFRLRHSAPYSGLTTFDRSSRDATDIAELVKKMLDYAQRPRKENESEQSATVRAALIGLVRCLQEFALPKAFTIECEREPFPPEIAVALIKLLMSEILDLPNRVSAKLNRPRGGSPRQPEIDTCIRVAVEYKISADRNYINDPKPDDRIVEAFGLASSTVLYRWLKDTRYADVGFSEVSPEILDTFLKGELEWSGRLFQCLSPTLKSNNTRAKGKPAG